MHSCLPASWRTPARLALMTAVGPPDCPTKRFPTNSDINFRIRVQFQFSAAQRPQNRSENLPTDAATVKEELHPAPSQIGEIWADFVLAITKDKGPEPNPPSLGKSGET